MKSDRRAKLDINDLIPVGLVLVVTGILLSFGAQVTGEVQDDAATCATGSYNEDLNLCVVNATSNHTPVNYAYNISNEGLEGVWNLSNRMPTIGLVAAIVIVIGLLVSGFGYLMGRR